jgi:AcrR family transcriptional regulator
MTKHLDPAVRTAELIVVALRVAGATGWRTLTHAAVAQAAGVSQGLVVARLGTKAEMLRSVMRAAVRDGVVPVVAEGLAAGDTHARRADRELKKRVAKWMGAA